MVRSPVSVTAFAALVMAIRPFAVASSLNLMSPEVGNVTTPESVSENVVTARLTIVVPLSILIGLGIVMLLAALR